jgi:hypothetical protein
MPPAMPQCSLVRLAGSPPACDAATAVLRGPVWSGLVQQQSEPGADGHGRCEAAWLPPSSATSEEAKPRFVSSGRSDRSWNPPTRELQLRPSQRIVQALAETLMLSARLPLHWHVNTRSNSTVAGRVASAAQRKRTQTDSAARAPRTVRSDVSIRPSTVHAELQTLCSNRHWPDSAALVKLARANQFEARRPSQRSAPAHRNLACQCRRVCAHDNSARKEKYADYVLLARYEVRQQHSRQSESPVRLWPIACAPRGPPMRQCVSP